MSRLRLPAFLFLIQVCGVLGDYTFTFPSCTSNEVYPMDGCDKYIQCKESQKGEIMPCPNNVPSRLIPVCRIPVPTTTTTTTTSSTTTPPGVTRSPVQASGPLTSRRACQFSPCPSDNIGRAGFSAPNNVTSPYYAVCIDGVITSFGICKKQMNWESHFDEARGKCVMSCDSSDTNKFPFGNDCKKYYECVKGRGAILRNCTPLFYIDGRCVDLDDYQCPASSPPLLRNPSSSIPTTPPTTTSTTARPRRNRPF